jgi:alpha-ketoglutaric semialdehyde dehydrogenase
MLSGYNRIGNTESGEGSSTLEAFSTIGQKNLPEKFFIATREEMEGAISKAEKAFAVYKDMPSAEKARFLDAIAEEILALGDELIERAMLESGLPESRLRSERGRTTGQLNLFAELLREGSWVEAVIDTGKPERKPLPQADLRKMLVPLGPVAIFGASNFPFAFSTAGGDTASALAAGNPVIVKAHESHLGTNELVASAIIRAAEKTGMPDGVFSFLVGRGPITGLQLVKHPSIKAIGFTGSYTAGMAIYRAAVNDRKVPIPVFAEMSSINPVLILPSKLEKESEALSSQLVASITLGAGQFCTNPGLIFLISDKFSDRFLKSLTQKMAESSPAVMLNESVCRNYYRTRQATAHQKGVIKLWKGEDLQAEYKASSTLLQVDARDFIVNPELQSEIFGPASLVVKCGNEQELTEALQSLHGQLTATVIGESNEIKKFKNCLDILASKVGRIVFNGVPTGVEVCYAMVHGGPFPATTDARSTSVGADAIKRFTRPICFQDCPPLLIPEALKNENPLKIMRRVNGQFTQLPI